jgi:hypothetical protein
MSGKTQEAFDCQRKCRVAIDLLRGESNPQVGLTNDGAFVRRDETQQHVKQCRLAGAIQANDRDDLAWRNLEIDAIQKGASAALDRDLFGFDQRCGRGRIHALQLLRQIRKGGCSRLDVIL